MRCSGTGGGSFRPLPVLLSAYCVYAALRSLTALLFCVLL